MYRSVSPSGCFLRSWTFRFKCLFLLFSNLTSFKKKVLRKEIVNIPLEVSRPSECQLGFARKWKKQRLGAEGVT